ncbi:MAG: glutamate-1-semialdehyde 2,1-aminomutase, partial [Clostridia bacterium]|nr:glutamate-1-semialdehyde 2,1-aminomutase [Clostridia bacterium]
DGCYHGHSDSFLVKAGSGALTLGVPTSPGVPEALAKDTLNAPYNDLDYLESLLQKEGNQIAAIIVEPIAGNMGMVLPKPGFLAGLREMTQRYGILLIFDEVITGFRVAYGGAQAYYGVYPDLTCLGKIIGGGLPVGAFGGKQEIMAMMTREGQVYQAGTLSGNPLAVTAGIATLKLLQQEGFYTQLEAKAKKLAKGLQEAASQANCPAVFHQVGSMLCTFFTSEPVYDYNSAIKSDTQKYAAYFRRMLEEGIYLAPSQFETTFISAALSEADLAEIIRAAQKAFAALT